METGQHRIGSGRYYCASVSKGCTGATLQGVGPVLEFKLTLVHRAMPFVCEFIKMFDIKDKIQFNLSLLSKHIIFDILRF